MVGACSSRRKRRARRGRSLPAEGRPAALPPSRCPRSSALHFRVQHGPAKDRRHLKLLILLALGKRVSGGTCGGSVTSPPKFEFGVASLEGSVKMLDPKNALKCPESSASLHPQFQHHLSHLLHTCAQNVRATRDTRVSKHLRLTSLTRSGML